MGPLACRVLTDFLSNPILWDDPVTGTIFCFLWHLLKS